MFFSRSKYISKGWCWSPRLVTNTWARRWFSFFRRWDTLIPRVPGTALKIYMTLNFEPKLRGGFKHFSFSPQPEEMIQLDEHIFQMGWFNHQLLVVKIWSFGSDDFFCKLNMSFRVSEAVTPWKINDWNIIPWRFGKSFSFLFMGDL